jgi:5'-nucleotidase (lipoprotein e(P4) family)
MHRSSNYPSRTLGLLAAALLLPSAALSAQAAAAPAVPQNDLLNATLWVSNSVEYKATTLMAYQLAKIRLDQALADKNWTAETEQKAGYQGLPPAIVLDVDETVLDNGAYESWLIKTGKDYGGKTYDLWTQSAAGKAIPGAVEFFKYAESKGVTIFYVSNRTAAQEENTRKNLQALGFPMGPAGVDTFLFVKEPGHDDWGSAKGTRRAYVAAKYRVLLLFGDNYGDFSDDAVLDEAGRLKSFQSNIAHVGRDWIFISNPEYGSFETAPFKGDYSIPADTRRLMKIDALPDWAEAPK